MDIELLKKLLNARGVSGDEGEIRSILRKECEARGASVMTDALGSVIARKEKPGARRVALDAHMDEVGFLITGADADGSLRYQPVGGVDTRVVMAKRALVGKDRLPGVFSVKAIHLASEDEMKNTSKHKDLRIDIGANDKAEAERLCPPGCTAVFDSPPTLFGDGRIVSRALDDRVGCFSLLAALEHDDLPVDLTCVFAVQEEIGLRGARAAAQRVQPELGIAFEGTSANDLGDVASNRRVTEQGKGVAISFMDGASIGHRILRKSLETCAAEHAIPWHAKRGLSGGNDAGAIQRAYGARPTAVLSVPCRYIHSAQSTAALRDIAAARDLAAAFLYDFPKYEGQVFN
ncbi:MAG: M20/M25/M40 family metallo-hydrolase [Oscillospiraceae bacterium]|jgi:endoglucanase|nr:M20/M25/M40 family metallo-hydrolase [Oscillospiraceae bacterium]